MIPLYKRYPSLKAKLPYISLGDFPTPIKKLDRIGEQIGIDSLFLKRDDLSGKVYGGNKLRKLEFILGDALHANVKEVLTFGAVGSNHALATAIYANRLGLKSISMLVHQPNAYYVRNNLLMSYHFGAEIHLYPKIPFIIPLANPVVLYQLLKHGIKNGKAPKIIPFGGSSPRGVVGYVNAAMELEEQIVRGEIPNPDYIYVASGSMGTAAGLILGLRAINSKTKVVSVRVNSSSFVNVKGMVKLICKTNSLLSRLDPCFPKLKFSESDVEMRHGFFGNQYALFTQEGVEAADSMRRYQGIRLEGTYTGKALAALFHDAARDHLKNKTVLFWNTYNSIGLLEGLTSVDYHKLPACFHRYFEQDVQYLDRIY